MTIAIAAVGGLTLAAVATYLLAPPPPPVEPPTWYPEPVELSLGPAIPPPGQEMATLLMVAQGDGTAEDPYVACLPANPGKGACLFWTTLDQGSTELAQGRFYRMVLVYHPTEAAPTVEGEPGPPEYGTARLVSAEESEDSEYVGAPYFALDNHPVIPTTLIEWAGAHGVSLYYRATGAYVAYVDDAALAETSAFSAGLEGGQVARVFGPAADPGY